MVVNISGYTIDDLKPCLIDLATFISDNLSPNRLQDFDIESIKSVENYSDIPINVGLNFQNLQ